MVFFKPTDDKTIKKLIEDIKKDKTNKLYKKVSPPQKKAILKYQDSKNDHDIIFDGTFRYIERPRPLTKLEKIESSGQKTLLRVKHSDIELRLKSLSQLKSIAKKFGISDYDKKDRNRLYAEIYRDENNKKRI